MSLYHLVNSRVAFVSSISSKHLESHETTPLCNFSIHRSCCTGSTDSTYLVINMIFILQLLRTRLLVHIISAD